MKTIVYIGGELPDKDASALRIIGNAKALRDYGYNVVLIGQSKEIKDVVKTEFYGFVVFLVPFPSTRKEWMKDLVSIKCYTSIIEMVGTVDAIVCYNFHAVVLSKMIKYGRKRLIPVIADCTEWHTVYHLRGLKKVVKWADIQARMRYVQFRTDGNIVISHYFDQYYRNCNNIIVPPLVDKTDIKWKAIPDSHNPKDITFVYAGKVGIGKDALCDCIRSLYRTKDNRFQLNIIGVSKEEYLAQFSDDSNMLKELDGQIFFHGRVQHNVAVDFVKQADFSILVREHSKKNDSGFPTKFPESIACGTPVIATDFSDIKDYIVRYNLGIIVESITQVESAFLKAMNMDREQINELKRNCQLNNAFDYHSFIIPLGDFFQKLIN